MLVFFLCLIGLLPLVGGAAWAENQTPQGGQSGSPAGTGTQQQTQTGTQTGSQDGGGNGGGLTVEQALKEKREADNEAKNLRTRIKAMEAELNTFKQSNMTESQKLQSQLEQLTKERDEHMKQASDLLYANVRMQVERRIARLAPDAIDPDLLTDKLDFEKFVGDKGTIDEKALATEVTALRKLYPRQFTGSGTGKEAAAGAGGGGSGFDMNRAIRAAAGRG